MKRPLDTLRLATLLITALTTIFILVLFLSDKFIGFASNQWLTIVTMVTLFATFLSFATQLLATQFANPASLTISLLGYPYSGKTVFLTILFNELATRVFPGFVFSPYGSETIEKVTEDLNRLMQGQWLPPTPPDTLFFYRANATSGTDIFKRKHKIEIGDYAGEHLETLEGKGDNQWLHKSSYFKFVVQSEVILLAIDSKIMMSEDSNKLSIVENGMLAAMQLLVSEKGVDISRKMKTPVALLLMKSDLISDNKRPEIEQRLSRLVIYCHNHCSNFKIFWVSSVGEVGIENSLLGKITPEGVVDPILWAIKLSR